MNILNFERYRPTDDFADSLASHAYLPRALSELLSAQPLYPLYDGPRFG